MQRIFLRDTPTERRAVFQHGTDGWILMAYTTSLVAIPAEVSLTDTGEVFAVFHYGPEYRNLVISGTMEQIDMHWRSLSEDFDPDLMRTLGVL